MSGASRLKMLEGELVRKRQEVENMATEHQAFRLVSFVGCSISLFEPIF